MSTPIDYLTAITAAMTALAALLGALHRMGLRWPRRRRRPAAQRYLPE